ncbi:hypothetical protein [Pseudooceanicola batsensis]|uniref:hypothetical protein n=1 Tax=Pseudooceanicola batsensis TaxID=314255 RepID=UPI0011D20C3E|nr:hypothetical protein [Pseudooceanicola batsensis]
MLLSTVDDAINLIDRATRDTVMMGVDDLNAVLESAGAESDITTSNAARSSCPNLPPTRSSMPSWPNSGNGNRKVAMAKVQQSVQQISLGSVLINKTRAFRTHRHHP